MRSLTTLMRSARARTSSGKGLASISSDSSFRPVNGVRSWCAAWPMKRRCADSEDVRSDGPISLGQGGGPDGPVDCPPLSVLRGIGGAKSAAYSSAELQAILERRLPAEFRERVVLFPRPL